MACLNALHNAQPDAGVSTFTEITEYFIKSLNALHNAQPDAGGRQGQVVVCARTSLNALHNAQPDAGFGGPGIVSYIPGKSQCAP